ncbi:hypothetical protein ACYJW8_05120 [Frateuria aurantia]
MTKLILHIGGEKTGTSYLQHFLATNARSLLRRHRVLYPATANLLVRDAHLPLVASLLERGHCDFLDRHPHLPPQQVFSELDALVARSHPDTVLLSAEHFSSRFGPAQIKSLARHLSAYEVQIVLYVRRQDELAISRFSTALRCGERRWLDLSQVTPADRYYNPLAIIEEWASVFGTSAVQVRSYAQARRTGLAQDLISFAGLTDSDMQGLRQVSASNEKVNLQEAYVLHRVNQRLPTWGEAYGENDPDRYSEANRLRSKLLASLPGCTGNGARTTLDCLVHSGAGEALMRTFAEVNRELVDRHKLPAEDFALTPPSSPPAAALKLDHMLADAVIGLGQQLLSERRRRFTPLDLLRRPGRRLAARLRPHRKASPR